MPTLSQFKSKYIIERRSKNVGDEGTKNIVKKLLGKDATPDDGGKAGQARIEKELGLNKSSKTTTNQNRFFTDQPDSKTLRTTPTGDEGQFKSSKVKFDSGAKGKFVSGSPEMGGESKKFIQNRRKRLQTKVLEPKTTNVVVKDKFSDVKRFQDLNKRAQEILNKSNNKNTTVADIAKQNNIKKISQSEVKPIKPNNVIKAVNKTSKTVNLPDVKPNTSRLNLNRTSNVSLPNFVGKTPGGVNITAKNYIPPDPEVEKLIKDAENLKNPKSLKAYKTAKKDFKSFVTNPKVVRKISPVTKFASGVGAALDARSNYKQSRDMGYNKVQSLLRTGVIGTGQIIGGVKGAALGTKLLPFGGTVIGGIAGYNLGGTTAQKAFDTLATNKGRRRLKKNFTNFMDNVRGKNKK